jgi:hypothetical protein
MKNKPKYYPNSTRIKLSPIAINKPVKAKKNEWRWFERFDSLGEMPDEWWAMLQKRYEEAKKLKRININTRIRYR